MALRAAYMAMHRRTDSEFAKYGVTADQFVLMATLERGGSMTQRELARQMPSDPSTVRAMLVLLENQGFIERESHPTDSRALLVSLTAAGKRKFRQLWKAGDEIRSQMFRSVPKDELMNLIERLQNIAASLSSETTGERSTPSKPLPLPSSLYKLDKS